MADVPSIQWQWTAGPAPARIEDAHALHRSGRLVEAEAVYARYLAAHPDDVLALTNAGALAVGVGNATLAVERLERAVALAPEFAAARHNLGHALTALGRAVDALPHLEQAVALNPALVAARNSLGIALEACGRRDEAIAAFACAVDLAPSFVDAAANLGDLLTRNDDIAGALEAFERALAADPAHLRARTGRAYARVLSGDLDRGRAELEALAATQPADTMPWQTLATVRWWAGDGAAARAAYQRLLALDPQEFDAHVGLAATLLADGRCEEGWRAFETRPDGAFGAPRRFAELPQWDGSPMVGTLLLHAEQGLGDVVQFVRFAALARERVGRIVLACDGYWATLAPLVASAPGIDTVAADPATAAGVACEAAARASVLSLPFLLGTGCATFVDRVPYLAPPVERARRWRARLGARSGPRIGLAWGSYLRRDLAYLTRSRFVPPPLLAPLFDATGAQFYSLQPGPLGGTDAFGAHAGRIIDWTAELGDFADTAALIAELDCVISTDTSVAHVAGALGRSVLMIDRIHGCWRWRMQRHSGPWYPALEIFAQERFGDWTEPIAAACAALRRGTPVLAPQPGVR